MHPILQHLRRLGLFDKTKFVMLYGSQAKGEATPQSDIDICLSLDLPPSQRFKARVKLLAALPEKYDVHIFEDLPMYVQKEVLGGKILYCQNKRELIDRAIAFIREYEDFEPIYDYYISQRGEASA